MSFSYHPLNIMFLLTILSAFICIQLVTAASSEPNEQLNLLLQSASKLNNEDLSNIYSESDEEIDNLRRSASFLRFGRGGSPTSSSFLRFGRQNSPSSGSFLRFGRQMSPSSGSFLRFGRGSHDGAAFLRFGRRALQISPSNFHRFARKGEFLRFG